ncbi:MAG: group II intron maturase-specific domain-containing protein [Cytophagaceae bacterium]
MPNSRHKSSVLLPDSCSFRAFIICVSLYLLFLIVSLIYKICLILNCPSFGEGYKRGWLNYFCLANMASKLQRIDAWVRNRLRYCIWTDWKKPERKRKNLVRLGVPYGKAYAFSRTRKGGWAIAQSPILTTTITLDRLRKRGYESLESYYQKVSPMFNEPLYT